MGYFVVPPVAGEAVGVFYGGGAALVVKERAEGVVGVIILDGSGVVDNQSNAGEAVVQVEIDGVGLIAVVLGDNLVVGVDVDKIYLKYYISSGLTSSTSTTNSANPI